MDVLDSGHDKHSQFNSNETGVNGSLFGLPFIEADATVVVIPVPWDATVSYYEGAADGPRAVLKVSVQLDLEVSGRKAPWKKGIWMEPIDEKIHKQSHQLRNLVAPYQELLEQGDKPYNRKSVIAKVDAGTKSLNAIIKKKVTKYINQGKIVGLLGGDHSSPLGSLEALSEKYHDFGVLQIDAHMDLRQSYEGFEHSHASIMHNALKINSISKLVQVGVRDYCEEELKVVQDSNERIITHLDRTLKDQQYEGVTWATITDEIISQLPDLVYVSFDIDGLNPHLCPGTGTPVPGGLEFTEAIYLLEKVVQSGRKVIGFDLCEVAPQEHDKEWNANVGARVLYALCGIVG